MALFLGSEGIQVVTPMSPERRDVLYSLLRLQFGDRMADRWAAKDASKETPQEAEDLLETFLGRSATETIPEKAPIEVNERG